MDLVSKEIIHLVEYQSQKKQFIFEGTGVIGVSDKRTDNSGKAISRGTAPIRVAAGWTYQAHFAGDSPYEKKDSAIKT